MTRGERRKKPRHLEETTFTEMYLQEDVLDCAQDEFDLLRVRRASVVGVDLLRGCALVQGNKAVQQVIASSVIVVTSRIVGEVVTHWRMRQLLCEQVDLIQKQDNRRLDEPPRVANRVEQRQRFLHTIHALIFIKHLVILAQRDQEDERGDVFETVDPLFTFASLTTHVEQLVREFSNTECSFRDTSRLDTGSQNVLIRRKIRRGRHALQRVEVVCGRIVQLELAASPDGLPNTGILP